MRTDPTPRVDGRVGTPRFQIRVSVPGHQSSISPLVESLLEAIRDARGAEGREFEVETALREALANAILHGCRNDRSKVVECALSCTESEDLMIVVRDPGPGFDPASVPSPVTEKTVRSTHGRGLYLIKQLMDEVWFGRGGSEIHMLKRGTRGR